MEKNFEVDYETGYMKISVMPKLINELKCYELRCPNSFNESWAIKFYTATTDIKDAIGNIVDYNKKTQRCSVKMIYRGEEHVAKNVLIRDIQLGKYSQGQRVMITEHIDVTGHFGFLISDKRLINPRYPGLNFINIGWSDDKNSIYKRIDIYTGEEHTIKGETNPISRVK